MGKYNLKYQIAAGVILVISGTLVLLSDYIKDKRDVVFSEMNLALSNVDTTESQATTTTDEEATNENQKEENNDYTYEEYLGIIDIPKISLYKGFYDKTSNLNNVKFNLYVLPESSYPDVTNGNLIIAGHSGNYNNSYFANLYKLEKEDTITIHYNNSKYIYKITNIYRTFKIQIPKNLILDNISKGINLIKTHIFHIIFYILPYLYIIIL